MKIKISRLFFLHIIPLALTALLAFSCTPKGYYTLESPDGLIKLDFQFADKQLLLEQIVGQDTLIRDSPIGLMVNERDLSQGVSLQSFLFFRGQFVVGFFVVILGERVA